MVMTMDNSSALVASSESTRNRALTRAGMDFCARSVHDHLHFTGANLAFDEKWTTRGNLLVLGDRRRLGEIPLDAWQTADVVSRQVGSASPGIAGSTPAAFTRPHLLTLEMAARPTLAEWHPRLMQASVQAAGVTGCAIFHDAPASSPSCNATSRRTIMTIVFANPLGGRTGVGQRPENRVPIAVLCIGPGLFR